MLRTVPGGEGGGLPSSSGRGTMPTNANHAGMVPGRCPTAPGGEVDYLPSPFGRGAGGEVDYLPSPFGRGAGGEGRSFAWLVIGQRFSGKAESRQFEDRLHQAAAGPLAGKVHFLGVRDDVPRILNELTLLVHPARQEPLSRVLLEAAAAGLAIVATDVGGTREIFPPESEVACLVPPDDVQAMSAAIGRLLGDATLPPATGRKCQETHRGWV